MTVQGARDQERGRAATEGIEDDGGDHGRVAAACGLPPMVRGDRAIAPVAQAVGRNPERFIRAREGSCDGYRAIEEPLPFDQATPGGPTCGTTAIGTGACADTPRDQVRGERRKMRKRRGLRQDAPYRARVACLRLIAMKRRTVFHACGLRPCQGFFPMDGSAAHMGIET